MSDHRNRAKLIDVQERRRLAQPLKLTESRAGDGTPQLIMEGYAATWEPYDCYGGPSRGGWVEQLDRSAMNRTLAENPDVMLLVNHEGLPLARTKSGNLSLSTDSHGLRMKATLDPSDPDVQRIAPKMKSTPDRQPLLDEMSFSFRVKDQVWDDNFSNRTITELSLQKGDVSVVNYGMNPNTKAVMSTDAVGALASLSNEDMMEIRKMDRTYLLGAMQTLQRAWRSTGADDEKEPDDDEEEKAAFGGKKAPPFGQDDEDEDDQKKRAGTWVNFDGSHLLYEGVCVTCQNDRAKTPSKYAGVGEFADPGYLGPDGKPAHDGNGVKRYPIDEKHVQAAWSYINMPKNQKGYTASQLASIKSKIKAAMKRFGHEVSEGKSLVTPAGPPIDPELGIADISHVEAVRKFGGGVTLVAVMSDGSRTPLPSFKQSGCYTSSPASGGGPFGSSRDWAPQPIPTIAGGGGGGRIDYQKIAPHAETDPHECDVPTPQPSADAGSGFRDLTGAEPDGIDVGIDHDIDATPTVDNPTQQIDDIHEDEDEVAGMGDEEISLSVDDRLRELRKDCELPDLPTVDAALQYVRQLA